MPRSILLDSNLLLLLLIGSFDVTLIPSFKRVSAFSFSDFDLLRDFSSTSRLVTTPHVLTEVPNLANALPERNRLPWLRHFGLFAARFEEVHVPIIELAQSPVFAVFGLTDAAISSLSDSVILLTEDGRLRAYLARRGRRTFRLSDVRARQAALFQLF